MATNEAASYESREKGVEKGIDEKEWL